MKIALSLLVAFTFCAVLSSCQNVEITTENVKYDPTGKNIVEHYTRTEKGFTQGWSNGAGKTVDVHPEVSLIGQ